MDAVEGGCAWRWGVGEENVASGAGPVGFEGLPGYRRGQFAGSLEDVGRREVTANNESKTPAGQRLCDRLVGTGQRAG